MPQRWAPRFATWDACLAALGIPALEACLRFASSTAGAHALIVGVDHAAQLAAILRVPGAPLELPAELTSDDPDLIDPSRWPLRNE